MHRSDTLGSAERPTCAAGLAVPPVALPTRDIPNQPPRGETQSCRTAGDSPTESPPAGLYLLCLVEALAGFALYTLSALLVLFLTDRGGHSQGVALRWIGTFNGLCYVAPLIGGPLADHVLGLRVAVRLGAALLAGGLLALALAPDVPALAFVSLVAGSALFRSNIVALVGRLYPHGDSRRGGAYRMVYTAFNLGAVLAPVATSVLVSRQNFSAPFILAAGAMLLALLALQFGNAILEHADHTDDADDYAPMPAEVVGSSFARWLAIGVVAQAALLFTIAYGQSDGTLLLWARDQTRRSLLGFEVPASLFASVPALLVLLLSPLFSLAERWMAAPSAVRKLLAGFVCTAFAFGVLAGAARFGNQPVSALWLLGAMALLTAGELLVMPTTLALVSQLAPLAHSATALALLYGANAVGLWCAGLLGGLWEHCPKGFFFALLTILPILAGLLVFIQSNYLRDQASPSEQYPPRK